ncbi:MAG TPA: 50S ribosomal protein L9, partial [Bryobacteraceae bacterium]|nr:50S ribosomal protein L9 [Bryobacteraceae bacterium]
NRGDVVKVRPGFARNYLLPNRLAVPATEANKKIVEQEKEAYLRREAKLAGEARDLAGLLANVTLTFTVRAGEEGHLFGSVTSKDIAEALEKQNFHIDRRKIQLDDPIKQVGEFKVPVRLHREVTQEIAVQVNAENA